VNSGKKWLVGCGVGLGAVVLIALALAAADPEGGGGLVLQRARDLDPADRLLVSYPGSQAIDRDDMIDGINGSINACAP
jgi:hypothetical protein